MPNLIPVGMRFFLEIGGYGKIGAGLIGRIFNKTGIWKGSQKVLVSHVPHIRSCAYQHRYKLHVNHPSCNLSVNSEVKKTMEVMNMMAEGEEGGERKTFREHLHSTRENYFSGNQIIN